MMSFKLEEIEKAEGFDEYREYAAQQRAKLFTAYNDPSDAVQPEPKRQTWKKLKDAVLRHLVGKRCMYCEIKVEGATDLDVEHWRPKGGVTHSDRDRLGERRDIVDGHDGYWWLAYEWRNLTLSCRWCNSDHTDPPPEPAIVFASGKKRKEKWGSHPGKKNEFPIAGKRVFKPGEDPVDLNVEPGAHEAPGSWWTELDKEKPLLLHPYYDDPFDHFELDDEPGVLKGKTEKGKWTIEVCDLNRQTLIDERTKAAHDTSGRYKGVDLAFQQMGLNIEALEAERGDNVLSAKLADFFKEELKPEKRRGPSRGKGYSLYVELYLREQAKKKAA